MIYRARYINITYILLLYYILLFYLPRLRKPMRNGMFWIQILKKRQIQILKIQKRSGMWPSVSLWSRESNWRIQKWLMNSGWPELVNTILSSVLLTKTATIDFYDRFFNQSTDKISSYIAELNSRVI